MQLRQATTGDNAALIELTRLAPMEGSVSVAVDRGPDFFRFSHLQGDAYESWVIEDNGDLIGNLTLVRRRVRCGDRVTNLLYGCDLRVHPHLRRKGAAHRLYHHFLQAGLLGEEDIGEAEIIAANTRALQLVRTTRQDVCRWFEPGTVRMYQILPFRPYALPHGYTVRTATPEDLPDLVDVLRKSYAKYHVAPLASEETLRRRLNLDPTFALDNVRVAERNGRIVATAAFWDQNTIRRALISDAPALLKLGFRALGSLTRFPSFPAVPRLNAPLRTLYAREVGALPEHIDGLAAILRREANQMRREKSHHMLVVGFDRRDPLARVAETMLHTSVDVHLFHFAFSPVCSLDPAHYRDKPLFVDFSLI